MCCAGAFGALKSHCETIISTLNIWNVWLHSGILYGGRNTKYKICLISSTLSRFPPSPALARKNYNKSKSFYWKESGKWSRKLLCNNRIVHVLKMAAINNDECLKLPNLRNEHSSLSYWWLEETGECLPTVLLYVRSYSYTTTGYSSTPIIYLQHASS